MVSKASEDLPDPDRPENTIRALRGRSRWTFLRLCSRAPRMTRRSVILRFPSSVRGEARLGPHIVWTPVTTMVPDAPAFHRRPPMSQFDPAHLDRAGPPRRSPGGPLEVPTLHVGPYENNAYLLRDPETNDALLVDAANEAERLLELLEGVPLVGIVTTHRHPDHIQALAGVLKAHDVWNGAHPADADAQEKQKKENEKRVVT